MKWVATAGCLLLAAVACGAMNCDSIESSIEHALAQYEGRIGTTVRLLSVIDEPASPEPGDWIAVSVGLAPLVPNPVWSVQTWHFQGTVTQETGPMPLGVRLIDRALLLPCHEIVAALPEGFRVDLASAQLYFPLMPTVEEPLWTIEWGTAVYQIGAYTGAFYVQPE